MPARGTEKSAAAQQAVRVYLPDSRFRAGPFEALTELARELFRFRSHIRTLFFNDFKSSYRGTVLGVFWNIVLPIVPITVYILLVNIRVFPSYEGLNPALYIGFNVTLWYLLTGMITRPIDVVRLKASDSMKTSLPLSAAIASSFAQLSFDTLVRFVLLIAMIITFGSWPTPDIVGLVLATLIAFVFCMSLGLLLSILNMVYTDTQRLVRIILQYGLFLSGVIFPVSAMGPLAILEKINPFCVFITSMRDFLFFGAYPHMPSLLAWAAAGLVLLLVGIRFFYIMEHRVRGLA